MDETPGAQVAKKNVTELAGPPGSQAFLRGLSILEELSNFPNGCPLVLLSNRVRLNKSTTYRLIQGLQSCGYVKPAFTQGSYQLTAKMLMLGYKAFSSQDIFKLIIPYVEQLNLAFGCTVNVSRREGGQAILLYKVNGMADRTRTDLGQRVMLYCSAMGKAFLAFDEPAEVAAYWESNLGEIRRITENTITNFVDLRAQLDEIRKTLVSYDREENELGISCIAAPIFNIHDQVEYAISVSATTKKLAALGDDKIIAELHKAAVGISGELGCADYFHRRAIC